MTFEAYLEAVRTAFPEEVCKGLSFLKERRDLQGWGIVSDPAFPLLDIPIGWILINRPCQSCVWTYEVIEPWRVQSPSGRIALGIPADWAMKLLEKAGVMGWKDETPPE